MHRTAVSRQHPFETEIEQALHRLYLLAPRIPAGAPERVEVSAMRAPREVVAGEEEALLPQKDRVPFRVARRRDHHQSRLELDRIESGRFQLDARGFGADVVAMQHALASEALVELLVIGDIVLMRQQK